MRLWRISNHADLSGEGGRLAEGRWNYLGRRIVYLAEHPALALLETLVHLEVDAEDMPVNYRLLSVEAPDDLGFEAWIEADLDSSRPDWRSNGDSTRQLAERFFEEGRHALMRVPSVLVPEAYNFILNPAHGDASRLRIISDVHVAFDERLLRSR
jgi:RES domain-containing protein